MRGLTVEDILMLTEFEDVRVSPTNAIAISVRKADIKDNKNKSQIFVLSEGKTFYIEGDSNSLPRWSEDGEELVFSGRINTEEKVKGSGLYLWSFSSPPRLLSWFDYGIQSIEWYGKKPLVLSQKPVEGFYEEDYFSTDRLPLWFDGNEYNGLFYYLIYSVDPASGYKKELVREENTINSIAVCNKSIYYSVVRDYLTPYLNKLIRVDESGAREEVVDGYSIDRLRCIEGKLYATMHKGEIGVSSHYKLYIIDGGRVKCLSCGVLDRNITYIVGKLSNGVGLLANDSGSSKLYLYDGGFNEVLGKNGYIHTADSNGKIIAYIYSEANIPMELYTYDGSMSRKVTSFNSFLEEVKLYKATKVGFKDIDGWVMLPDIEGKAPLILYIHGGPKGMYGYRFNPEIQLMVTNGFAIAYSNPIGSDGYSEKFADIRGKYGEDDFNQLISFLNYVIENYEVDAERLGVTGISYGGYMTNVMITKSKAFKAAVSENGIADWISDYHSSDIGYWFNEDQIGGSPQDNLDEYIKKSPFFFAKEVSTPVLIIHSMHDYRCFIDQSLAMHTALVKNGKESRLVIFNKGSHAHSLLAEPRHRRLRYEIKLKFFKEKLKT
ncbi:MAG: S9 family peptidase [Caldisphaeraceae archaeon]|nr:S9 family peptidase [Caldisphaeraceae archaeon]